MYQIHESVVPCKNCEKKGCGSYHSKCEPYQKFVKEREEIRSRRHTVSIHKLKNY